MNANFNNSTIAIAVAKCSDFARKAIQHNLDNSECNLVVIYDQKTPEDYIVNDRVKYIKNTEGRNFPKILNQLIENVETEYVIYVNWRYRPAKENILLAFEKLNEGYGLVDLSAPLLCTVFSKHLVAKIGLFDERFVGGHCVDWDMIYNLMFYNVAHYNVDVCYHDDSLATPNNPTYTTWFANDPVNVVNYREFAKKWIRDGNEVTRMYPEININDRQKYKGKYEDRVYLPASKSETCYEWVQKLLDHKLLDIKKISFTI